MKVLENGKELSEKRQIRVEKGDDQILNIYLKAGDYKFSVQKY
jgi:hypothetical protein